MALFPNYSGHPFNTTPGYCDHTFCGLMAIVLGINVLTHVG
jgi:hypothetical protein